MTRGQRKGDDATQAVADDHGPDQTKLGTRPGEVVGKAIDGAPLPRNVAETVSAKVDGDRSVPSAEVLQLRGRVATITEDPVHQHDRWVACSTFLIVQSDTVTHEPGDHRIVTGVGGRGRWAWAVGVIGGRSRDGNAGLADVCGSRATPRSMFCSRRRGGTVHRSETVAGRTGHQGLVRRPDLVGTLVMKAAPTLSALMATASTSSCWPHPRRARLLQGPGQRR